MASNSITIQGIQANGLTFTCRVAGNPKNEPIILLHGWPETSHMWEELMQVMAIDGYYCLAPNMRGFSPGARPKGKANYDIDLLSNDILAIAKSQNIEKFHLIGHDWGAGVGWFVTNKFEENVKSWTGMSVPHLQAFGKAIVNDPEQAKMSAYMKGFQLPYLPELRLKQNHYQVFRKLWKESSKGQVEDYLKVFSSKGIVRASLNYYRKNYRTLTSAANKQILGDINVPTLFIWGNKDLAVGRKSVEMQSDYMKGPYEFLELEDAGHWLIQTRFPEIKNAILKHISNYPISQVTNNEDN